MKLVRTLWWIFLLMPSGCLFAQPAPTIVSTLQTTNTGATSVSVGCAVGSSTCTGGISFGTAAGTSISLSGGYLELQSNVPGTTTYRLYNNAGTLTWNGVVLAAGGSISGTTGKLSKFTAPGAVGDSICSESGTTITCVDTLSATTLTGTLSTVSQPNVTTMAGLASVGTLTTGAWNATKIGLVYGGTNADLSGTGGTSQFLRQNSSGAAVTVVRPAVSDLSDSATVALLNAANVFTTSTNGTFLQRISNTNAGASAVARLSVGNDVDADLATLRAYSSTTASSGFAGPSMSALVASGPLSIGSSGASTISFLINSAKVWGINGAGDFTVGASADIADSSGTPTIASGFGTSPAIVGTDYAFRVTQGSTTSSTGTVTFGHTWSNIPICTISNNASPGAVDAYPSVLSTTQIAIGTVSSANAKIYVTCRGY